MAPIRLLIVDDHTVVRQGIRMIVGTEASIQIVGEATDGQSAVQQAKNLRPDLILMDLVMPRQSGLDAIAAIKQNQPEVKVVVLTTFEDEDKIKAALQAGADGFMLKDADGEALLQAIQAAHRGEMPLHPRIARFLFKKEAAKNSDPQRLDDLTEREQEVLHLIAKGASNKEAARALNLSEGTIKIHVGNILSKLKVSTRTEAAVWAAQMGLVDTVEGHGQAANHQA